MTDSQAMAELAISTHETGATATRGSWLTTTRVCFIASGALVAMLVAIPLLTYGLTFVALNPDWLGLPSLPAGNDAVGSIGDEALAGDGQWPHAGQVGDASNVAATIFTGVAMGCVILTLLLQIFVLLKQHHAMVQQADHVAKALHALAGTKDGIRASVDAQIRSARVQALDAQITAASLLEPKADVATQRMLRAQIEAARQELRTLDTELAGGAAPGGSEPSPPAN